MVKTYSVKSQGNVKLSSNFTVKEFACKDNSDSVNIKFVGTIGSPDFKYEVV